MSIEHSAIAEPNIHEPKGASSALIDQVYLANGAGSGTWTNVVSAVFPVADKWTQIYKPAQEILLPGNAADAGRDTDDGTLLFDAAADELSFSGLPIPRDRVATTNLKFYAIWSKSTSATGDVGWRLEYRTTELGSATPVGWTSLGVQTTSVTTDNDTANEALATLLGTLDTTSLTNQMNLILRLAREGTNGSDTYAADARLIGLLVTYNIGDLGSDSEFV